MVASHRGLLPLTRDVTILQAVLKSSSKGFGVLKPAFDLLSAFKALLHMAYQSLTSRKVELLELRVCL